MQLASAAARLRRRRWAGIRLQQRVRAGFAQHACLPTAARQRDCRRLLGPVRGERRRLPAAAAAARTECDAVHGYVCRGGGLAGCLGGVNGDARKRSQRPKRSGSKRAVENNLLRKPPPLASRAGRGGGRSSSTAGRRIPTRSGFTLVLEHPAASCGKPPINGVSAIARHNLTIPYSCESPPMAYRSTAYSTQRTTAQMTASPPIKLAVEELSVTPGTIRNRPLRFNGAIQQ
eukprot:4110562-Prymnesium_polylepis.2